MPTPPPNTSSCPLPHHVAVIGAAGGLGQGVLSVWRAESIGFTAIVRSRPERITGVPDGSRVVLVTSLADRAALTEAFSGADAVITAMGVTSTSRDRSALPSANMATVEASMLAAGVDRIVVINTLMASPPGKPTSRAMRFFSWMPGTMGRGAREQQAVVDALGSGAFSSLRWTLVRAGVNSAARTSALWRRRSGTALSTPGGPSRMKPWAGGYWRKPRPMSLSAKHPLCHGAGSKYVKNVVYLLH